MIATLISTSTQTLYACGPFIWMLAGLLGAGYLIKLIKTRKTEGTKLGVLGMKGAGKTTYLAHLGLVERNDGGTTVATYEGRKVNVGHREMDIAAGKDIGGDEFMNYYKSWLVGSEKKDIIIFIFDGYRYLKSEDYRHDTDARLQFIYKNYKAGNRNRKGYKNLVVIASHLDEYERSADDMCQDILTLVGRKDYLAMFQTNFFATDMRKRDWIMDINLKIFA